MSIEQLIDDNVRQIPDWPVAGVTFRDITPICLDPEVLHRINQALAEAAGPMGSVDAVLGIEARGFIFAPTLALALGAGFVPVRKEGKLPADTIDASYELEYGVATIEIHTDALHAGDRVLIMDDVLATGGTMKASAQLVAKAGASVAGFVTIMELAGLNGRSQLGDTPVTSLRVYA